jgi:hypothetical protein
LLREAVIAPGRKFGKRVKKRKKTTAPGKIQARLQEMLEENLDGIGSGLVQKAIEGHYNAAQLLLRLSGVDPEPGPGGAPEEDRQQARMFFLEMVEEMLGERPDEVHTAKLAELPHHSKTR